MNFATAEDLKKAGLTKNKIRKLVKTGKLKVSHVRVKETGQIVKIYTRPNRAPPPIPLPLPKPIQPTPAPTKRRRGLKDVKMFISKWWKRFWKRDGT